MLWCSAFVKLFFKKLFIFVILGLYNKFQFKLCAEFQSPTMPATAQKVCGVVWWCGGGGVGVVA